MAGIKTITKHSLGKKVSIWLKSQFKPRQELKMGTRNRDLLEQASKQQSSIVSDSIPASRFLSCLPLMIHCEPWSQINPFHSTLLLALVFTKVIGRALALQNYGRLTCRKVSRKHFGKIQGTIRSHKWQCDSQGLRLSKSDSKETLCLCIHLYRVNPHRDPVSGVDEPWVCPIIWMFALLWIFLFTSILWNKVSPCLTQRDIRERC